jgi:uncharacterized damage-inducible protein DinB
MNAREAIKIGLDMAEFVSLGYLEDLTEAELLHRPAPNANHINWQLGHIIASENHIMQAAVPGSMPALPAGFGEKYTKDTASINDPSKLLSKAELLKVYREQRAATLAALTKQSDQDLDKPSPESIRSYAPNVAAAISMQGSHWLMHAGQWAVVRRQLGRPPMF